MRGGGEPIWAVAPKRHASVRLLNRADRDPAIRPTDRSRRHWLVRGAAACPEPLSVVLGDVTVSLKRPTLVTSSRMSTASPVRTTTVSFQARLGSVTPSRLRTRNRPAPWTWKEWCIGWSAAISLSRRILTLSPTRNRCGGARHRRLLPSQGSRRATLKTARSPVGTMDRGDPRAEAALSLSGWPSTGRGPARRTVTRAGRVAHDEG